MGRWLSKAEREERDVIVVKLYNDGVQVSKIAAQFRRNTGWVYERLKLLGIRSNRRIDNSLKR